MSFYAVKGTGFTLKHTLPIAHRHPLPRDTRGRIILHSGDAGFTVYLPGIACEGTRPTISDGNGDASIHCKDSDDPWPLVATKSDNSAAPEMSRKAFYHSARNFYTGVVTPAFNFELPPFYDAAELPRANGSALLVHETSGAVELIEGMARKPVSGVRDWGSDFAVLRTQCGTDPIVLVSGSGEAIRDSLRAYAIPAQEAIAVSAPFGVDGTISAITPLNLSSAAVIVRKEDTTGSYNDEVLRVSTLCN